jgi:hypothetical protein
MLRMFNNYYVIIILLCIYVFLVDNNENLSPKEKRDTILSNSNKHQNPNLTRTNIIKKKSQYCNLLNLTCSQYLSSHLYIDSTCYTCAN